MDGLNNNGPVGKIPRTFANLISSAKALSDGVKKLAQEFGPQLKGVMKSGISLYKETTKKLPKNLSDMMNKLRALERDTNNPATASAASDVIKNIEITAASRIQTAWRSKSILSAKKALESPIPQPGRDETWGDMFKEAAKKKDFTEIKAEAGGKAIDWICENPRRAIGLAGQAFGAAAAGIAILTPLVIATAPIAIAGIGAWKAVARAKVDKKLENHNQQANLDQKHAQNMSLDELFEDMLNALEKEGAIDVKDKEQLQNFPAEEKILFLRILNKARLASQNARTRHSQGA